MPDDLYLPGYRAGERLYQAEASRVIAATRLADGADVAIKVLRADASNERLVFARAQRERELLARTAGVGVVEVLGLEHAGAEAALVLRRVRGMTLRQKLGAGALTLPDFFAIARPLVAAVARIHRARVIHRDIKPDNVLLDETGRPVVCDFGIAALLPRGQEQLHEPDLLQGSLHYLAPEQTGRMNRGVDMRTDLYSVGITLYEMLAGRTPFAGTEALDLVHAHLATAPIPLSALRTDLPETLVAIVARLLAKEPAQRYQSAGGLGFDLARVAAAPGETLVLGSADMPEHLVFATQLFGRAHEAARLDEAIGHAAFASTFALITGPAGMGKTSTLLSARAQVQRARGRWGFGRFDQNRQNEPYSALRDAFAGICQGLLSESEETLAEWRTRLREGLGPIAAVVTDVVPALERVIGKPAPVPTLGPGETRNRFVLAMRRFVAALCSPNAPLVLALDDLHLADGGSLALLEALLHDTAPSLLLLASADAAAVGPGGSLGALVAATGARHGRWQIELGPLGGHELRAWVAAILHQEPDEVAGLAAVLGQKTGHNPFFVRQLLQKLEESGALCLCDAEDGARWSFDLGAVARADVPDDLAAVMRAELGRVEEGAARVAGFAAVMVGDFSAEALVELGAGSAAEVTAALAELGQAGLITKAGETWQFAHPSLKDEAARALGADDRQNAHARLGWKLLGRAAPHELPAQQLFAIADHLSHAGAAAGAGGRSLGVLQAAGEQALRSTAYEVAARFYGQAVGGLDPMAWQVEPQAAFAAELGLAKSLYLTGRNEAGEAVFARLCDRALPPLKMAEALSARVALLTCAGEMNKAIAVGRSGLARLGHKIPARPSPLLIMYRLLASLAVLRRRSDQQLVEHRRGDDAIDATSMLVDAVGPAAYWSNVRLYAAIHLGNLLTIFHKGYSASAAYAFARQAMLAVGLLRNFRLANRLCSLARQLLARMPTPQYQARIQTLMSMTVEAWYRPMREVAAELPAATKICEESGDLEYANYSASFRTGLLFAAGHNLRAVREVVADAARRCTQWGYKEVASVELQSLVLLQILEDERTLEGTDPLGKSLLSTKESRAPLFMAATRTLQVLYVCGHYELGFREAAATQDFGKEVPGNSLGPDHDFWQAMAGAALPENGPDRRAADRILATVIKRHQKLVRACAANTTAKLELMIGEQARRAGKSAAALDHYARAAAHAAKFQIVHLEAIALERRGRLLRAVGLESEGQLFLREACDRYRLWGARAKTRQLEREFSALAPASARGDVNPAIHATRTMSGGHPAQSPTLLPESSSTKGVEARSLDLGTMLGVAQALAEERTVDGVLQRLLGAAIANAGAQRGVLVLKRDGEFMVEAESVAGGAFTRVDLPLDRFERVPIGLLRLCLRSQERVVVSDASTHEAYEGDRYVAAARPRSVLAAPIIRQGAVVGLVYLENSAVTDAFTPARVELLQVLAAQAAISLDNAQLYSNLEAKVAQRTRELDARNRQMRLVLDNVQQGLMTIDRAGVMTEERSAIITEWFGPCPAGTTLASYLGGIDADTGALFALGWDALLDNFLPFEVLIEQLPKKFSHAGRVFALAFRPIFDEAGAADPAAFSRMLVMISDVTDELLRQRSERAQRELGELYRRMATDRGGVAEFRREAAALVAAISADAAPSHAEVQRLVHTLKGNAGLFGLGRLAELCQRLESEMAQTGDSLTRSQAAELGELWREMDGTLQAFMAAGAGVAARAGDAIELGRRDVEQLLGAIARRAPPAVLIDLVDGWTKEPLERRFARIAEQAQRLGRACGKGELQVTAEAGDVRLDASAWASFWSALVHVLRNAVDHGLEFPDERRAAGKSSPSQLRLGASLGTDRLVIEVSDDGRGIAWEKIAAKARKAGLPAETHEHLVAALFTDGVSSRDEASMLSGRGVGAGAVRAECESRGGHVEVVSEPGRGTTFRFVFAASEARRRGPHEPPTPAPMSLRR